MGFLMDYCFIFCACVGTWSQVVKNIFRNASLFFYTREPASVLRYFVPCIAETPLAFSSLIAVKHKGPNAIRIWAKVFYVRDKGLEPLTFSV